jgi:iron complex transport system substrate-binding protein
MYGGIKKIYTLALIFLISGAACSRNTNQAEVYEPEKNEVRRIISAAPSNTEIITGLKLGERLIAVDPYSRDIEGVPPGLPLIDFFYPDTEAIIGLEPDLILVNEINSFGVADNPFKLLSDIGIRVVQVPTSVSIEGICSDIIFIAEELGVRERGEALVSSMKDEIKNIALAGEKLIAKKSVFFEVSAMPAIVSFGMGTYLNEMIEITGGRNIFAEQKGWFSASDEEIISRNPDIFLALAYHNEDPVSEIKSRRAFEGVNALRNNKVFAIDADSASRPSQNILNALRQMARAINPEYYETAR